MHGYIAFRRVERDLYLKICGRAVEHGDQLITSLGACGMYRPPIGPVSAIERAIVCMRMPGLADLRQPISRGFLHTATSGGAPAFFYARCAKPVLTGERFTGKPRLYPFGLVGARIRP